VPVLDRGSAIKGNRLDLLMPTHQAAQAWGRRTLLVTVWRYADQ
jgi:3D (Asp-Asp-Asp) domain-containing protein